MTPQTLNLLNAIGAGMLGTMVSIFVSIIVFNELEHYIIKLIPHSILVGIAVFLLSL